jgi:DnaK suppressor protein
MAVTIKKSKAKVSPATRAKVKSKPKAVKAEVKAKKNVIKVKKSKKAKTAKIKIAETKVANKKTVAIKAKAKIKAQIKPISPKTTARPKPRLKVSATKAKIINDVVTIETPNNINNVAVMQAIDSRESILTANTTKIIEQYMNKKQLVYFKGLLEQWKRELMEEVDHTLVEMKEAGVLADPNDCATQEETFNLELRTRDRERKLLKKIEEALQKIDNEEYGYCEACGIEIGLRRLEARPTATLCIDCKTLDEIKEKRS